VRGEYEQVVLKPVALTATLPVPSLSSSTSYNVPSSNPGEVAFARIEGRKYRELEKYCKKCLFRLHLKIAH
jgi:hypothetical protein